MSLREKAEEICEILATKGMDVVVRETANGVGIAYRNPGTYGDKEGYTASPVVYVTDNDDVNAEAESIANVFAKAPQMDFSAMLDLMSDWNKAKKAVVLRFIHPVGTLPEQVVVFDTPEGLDASIRTVASVISGEGCANVNEEVLKKWGISKAQLYDQALNNVRKETIVCDILGMIQELTQNFDSSVMVSPSEALPMYVVTNKSKSFGSSILLDPKAIRQTLEPVFKDEDLFIIPSSIHELIIVRAAENDAENLKAMIAGVNATQVQTKEILGYLPFRLSGTNLTVC